MTIVRRLFDYGPLLFAFGFLTPLIAQIIEHAGWTLPYGLSPLLTGFIVAGILGALAQFRGRWV